MYVCVYLFFMNFMNNVYEFKLLSFFNLSVELFHEKGIFIGNVLNFKKDMLRNVQNQAGLGEFVFLVQ